MNHIACQTNDLVIKLVTNYKFTQPYMTLERDCYQDKIIPGYMYLRACVCWTSRCDGILPENRSGLNIWPSKNYVDHVRCLCQDFLKRRTSHLQ